MNAMHEKYQTKVTAILFRLLLYYKYMYLCLVHLMLKTSFLKKLYIIKSADISEAVSDIINYGSSSNIMRLLSLLIFYYTTKLIDKLFLFCESKLFENLGLLFR